MNAIRERDGAMYGDYRLCAQQRVELHPATDRWMRGDRYGVIVQVRTKGVARYVVVMEKSGDRIKVSPDLLKAVRS